MKFLQIFLLFAFMMSVIIAVPVDPNIENVTSGGLSKPGGKSPQNGRLHSAGDSSYTIIAGGNSNVMVKYRCKPARIPPVRTGVVFIDK